MWETIVWMKTPSTTSTLNFASNIVLINISVQVRVQLNLSGQYSNAKKQAFKTDKNINNVYSSPSGFRAKK